MNGKKALSIGLVLLALVLSSPGWGMDFPDYSAPRLRALMDGEQAVFLLCPLSPLVFNEKNIPGSVNIPLKEIRKTKALPQNKDAVIVTYCLGPK